MNLNLSGLITLRSSLAHGAFEAASIVVPFRREKILQRNPDGTPATDPYSLAITDPKQREELRQYAQRLLRIIWQSRGDGTMWTYQQFADRVHMATRSKNTVGDVAFDVLTHMGATHPTFFNDDIEFFDRVVGAADQATLLSLLREDGERMLIVARMQAESAARHEKRELPKSDGLFNLVEPATPALKPAHLPHIADLPIYSGNAIRNGLVRQQRPR
jgi:hypothetical protein